MEEDLGEEDNASTDSINIEQILELVLPDDDPNQIHYLCRNADNTEEIYHRSDLMNDGAEQMMVLQFELRHPPQ